MNSQNDRIEDIFFNNIDNDFFTIKLSDNIAEKLLSYQILHCQNIIYSLKKNGYALDGSDTGTGKTYSSLAACKQLNLKPFIICPKTIINNWKNICKYFNIKYLGIVNYETIKNGKYYIWCKGEMKRVTCPYIEFDENKMFRYKWKLPNNSILIFDEVHKCKDKNTYNSNLLQSAINIKRTNKLLMLSATLTDKPKNFKVFGYMLRFYTNMRHANNWIKNTSLISINKQIYPKKGSRMKISELGTLFPKNQISADCYTVGYSQAQAIQKNYEIISDVMEILKKKKENDFKNPMVALLRARQEIEIMKVPILIDLAKDFRENNLSVVIFVNFNQTLKILTTELKTNCVIHGEQTGRERHKNIDDFMENKEKIIICNIEAGGQSINLHDKLGGHQRVSLICPSFNSISLIQALGRIHRAGSKSSALQRIIFCADTVEESICGVIQQKLNCLNNLNDGDLDSSMFLKKKNIFN